MITSMAGFRTYVGPAYYDSQQPVTLLVTLKLRFYTTLPFRNLMSFQRHLFAQDRSRPHYSGPFYLWCSAGLPLPSSYIAQTSYLRPISSPRPYLHHTVTWTPIMPHFRGQVLAEYVPWGSQWQLPTNRQSGWRSSSSLSTYCICQQFNETWHSAQQSLNHLARANAFNQLIQPVLQTTPEADILPRRIVKEGLAMWTHPRVVKPQWAYDQCDWCHRQTHPTH